MYSHILCIYIYVYMHICVCIYMHMYRYIYIYTFTHISFNKTPRHISRAWCCSHPHTYIHLYICTSTYITRGAPTRIATITPQNTRCMEKAQRNTCKHLPLYIYVYMYMYTYIYTHTRRYYQICNPSRPHIYIYICTGCSAAVRNSTHHTLEALFAYQRHDIYLDAYRYVYSHPPQPQMYTWVFTYQHQDLSLSLSLSLSFSLPPPLSTDTTLLSDVYPITPSCSHLYIHIGRGTAVRIATHHTLKTHTPSYTHFYMYIQGAALLSELQPITPSKYTHSAPWSTLKKSGNDGRITVVTTSSPILQFASRPDLKVLRPPQ